MAGPLAYPNTKPDCSASVVFWPMADAGATNSTRRNWEVFKNSASAATLTPGAMAPPR